MSVHVLWSWPREIEHMGSNTSNIMLRVSAFTAVVVLSLSISPAASGAEQVKLSQMAGKWTGQGWTSRKKGAPKENVRCRMTAKYRAKARKLSVSGKCAANGGSFTLLGHIAEYQGSKKLTGRWINPRGIGATSVKGNRMGNRLTLLLDRRDKKTKTRYKTVWDLRRNGFTLSTGHANSAANALGRISFQR